MPVHPYLDPKVCKIMAFFGYCYGFRAIILHVFKGLGTNKQGRSFESVTGTYV